MKSLSSFGTQVATLALASCLSAWAGPGAHGPNGEHLDQAPSSSVGGLARMPDGSVNVPKLAQRRMELRTQIAPETELRLRSSCQAGSLQTPTPADKCKLPMVGALSLGRAACLWRVRL